MSERRAWLCAGDLFETLLRVGKSGQEDPAGSLEKIADFARVPGLPGVRRDYARSLIVLKADPGTKVRAELHMAPDIERLPPIQRTGVSTPTMDGLQLGFDSDRIDDASHQRSKSLFFTRRTRCKALTDLLRDFLQDWPHQALPTSLPRAHQELEAEGEKLKGILEELLRSPTQAGRYQEALKILGLMDPGSPAELLNKVRASLRNVLSRGRQQAGTASSPNERWNNSLSALYLHFQKRLDTERHLGYMRLERIMNSACPPLDVKNLVIQGAGDLSMNPWNVAFYHDAEKGPRIVIPPNEPFGSRHYQCLIGLRATQDRALHSYLSNQKRSAGNLAIAPLRFSPGRIAMADSDAANQTADCELKNELTFALYGKQIIRDGEVVEPVEIVDEFLDLRHVFDLPNLNLADTPGKEENLRLKRVRDELLTERKLDKSSAERIWEFGRKRPRILFGQTQEGDVWLLEHALLADQNLRHLACKAAISVPLDLLGAPKDWVTLCLTAWGYKLVDRPEKVEVGCFAWDLKEISRPVLRVRVRHSKYPCTMVGLGSVENGPSGDPDCVYLLAWGHKFQYADHTLWDCANVLQAAGARWALVIDEGQDVFQFFAEDKARINDFMDREKQYEDISGFFRVPLAFSDDHGSDRNWDVNRTSLRASIAFWQEIDVAQRG